jgi:hypothetical protein
MTAKEEDRVVEEGPKETSAPPESSFAFDWWPLVTGRGSACAKKGRMQPAPRTNVPENELTREYEEDIL